MKIRASKFLDFYGARKYFGSNMTIHKVVKFTRNNWKKFHGIPMNRGWRVFKIRCDEGEENNDI